MNLQDFILAVEGCLWDGNDSLTDDSTRITDVRQVAEGLVVDVADGDSFQISVTKR